MFYNVNAVNTMTIQEKSHFFLEQAQTTPTVVAEKARSFKKKGLTQSRGDAEGGN